MSLIRSPFLFDYLILAIFTCAMIRWAAEGNYVRTLYWLGAVVLNVGVLMGMK